MTVQAIEGFEGGGPQARIWTIDGGSGGASIGQVGPGPWSGWYYNPGSSGGVARPLKTNTATELFVMVRLNRSANNYNLWTFRHPDNSACGTVTITAGGVLAIYDSGATLRGTGTTVIPLNTWVTIEARIKVGNAATGLMQLRIHGLSTNEVSDTSAGDYQNGSNTAIGWLDINDSNQNTDDLIVYDATGATNNTWVGDKAVLGLFPTGQGASEQWNPPVASAQRWYFPDQSLLVDDTSPIDGVLAPAGTTGVGPPVIPAPDALWDLIAYTSTGRPRLKGTLSPTRRGTTIRRRDGGNFTWNAGDDVLIGQFISPGLAAQTITGTVKMQMQVRERLASNDARSQLVIRVVSQDGATVRGVIYAGDTGSLTDEWPTGEQNVTFPQDALSPATLTNIGAITEGDRLVVEFGFRGHAAGSNQDAIRCVIGDGGASGDLPDSESDTTSAFTYNPWIEFSNAITLSDNTNWEYVDEAAAPDDDGGYVETATDNEKDFYAFGNVPGAYTAAGPIAIKTTAKKVEPGVRTLTHVYNTGGADQAGSAIGLLTGSYAIQETLLDVDATDSAAWTDAKLNAIQAGPKATT